MLKPKLTVVILNHNTEKLLDACLNSISKIRKELNFEVIVSDNDSKDKSVQMVQEKYPWVKIVIGPNIGFANGNNRVRNLVKSDLVLFLNSDTLVEPNSFFTPAKYLEEHPNVGALTCKLILANGKIDPDIRRRFPTPWVAFTRLFLGWGKYYWYQDRPEDEILEVESIQGAYFLTRKKILDQINWFDEKYFFDGEDMDMCFQIQKIGYKIVYYPFATVTHLKGATKGKVKNLNLKIDPKLIIKRKMDGVNAMEYFYRKNLWSKYPTLLNWLVVLGIKILKLIRYIKIKYL